MIDKLRTVDENMKIGESYKIFDKYGACGRSRKTNFNATLLKKMDRFYLFMVDNNCKECIMKVDFITGDYILEGNLT